jgi:hypothetical protein
MFDETGKAPALLVLGLGPGAVEDAKLAGSFAFWFHLDHLRVLVYRKSSNPSTETHL